MLTRPVARGRIGLLPVDALTLPDCIASMLRLAELGRGGTVYTPNLDHVVRSARDAAFTAAYQRASLSIADGMPVVWAARLMGRPVPAKVSGSDWFEPLMQACAQRGHGVYLIGGRAGAAHAAQRRLQALDPGLRIVGIGPATRAIEADPALLDDVRAALRELRPAFAVVALGSPLQELWSDRVRDELAPTVFLGLGSALDLTAGLISRAPRWMSDAGLEWAYRLAREPRRLWRRYLLGGPAFLLLLARQWRAERRQASR